jgi:hypothetical protein
VFNKGTGSMVLPISKQNQITSSSLDQGFVVIRIRKGNVHSSRPDDTLETIIFGRLSADKFPLAVQRMGLKLFVPFYQQNIIFKLNSRVSFEFDEPNAEI